MSPVKVSHTFDLDTELLKQHQNSPLETNAEHNSTTILLIHTLFSSGKHWNCTKEILIEKERFDVLAPDLLPEQLSNCDKCVSYLANQVKEKARNGKAHVVGLSAGAHIAVKLAAAYPSIVSSVLISGLVTYPALLRPLTILPIYVIKRMMSKIYGGPAFTLRESTSITGLLAPLWDLQNFEVRIMIVAGLRHDDPQPALALKRVLSSRCVDAQVKGGRNLRHCWNLQRPDLFAKLIVAWVDNVWSDDLEKHFIDLPDVKRKRRREHVYKASRRLLFRRDKA